MYKHSHTQTPHTTPHSQSFPRGPGGGGGSGCLLTAWGAQLHSTQAWGPHSTPLHSAPLRSTQAWGPCSTPRRPEGPAPLHLGRGAPLHSMQAWGPHFTQACGPLTYVAVMEVGGACTLRSRIERKHDAFLCVWTRTFRRRVQTHTKKTFHHLFVRFVFL